MVLGLQHVIADHAPDRGGTNGQSCGRFVDRHLTTLAAFAFAVRRDLLAMTQGADTRACPAIATASRPGRIHAMKFSKSEVEAPFSCEPAPVLPAILTAPPDGIATGWEVRSYPLSEC